MTSTPPRHRSLSPRRTLVATLVASALALQVQPAGAVTNVMKCTPTANPTLAKVSPAAILPPDDGKYGFKFGTMIDGCVANTAKLNTWVPSDSGTPDGSLIAKAAVTLGVKGFGNCGFELMSVNPDAYPATGTIKLKWLDVNGKTIKSAKTTTASVRLAMGITVIGGFGGGSFSWDATADGIVSKGLGVGANIHAVTPIDENDPINLLFVGCAVGSTPIPGAYDPAPVKQIALKRGPTVTIEFP